MFSNFATWLLRENRNLKIANYSEDPQIIYLAATLKTEYSPLQYRIFTVGSALNFIKS